MVSEPDRISWGVRVLAPLAFFTAATVLVLLVHSSLNAGTDGESPAANDRGARTDNRGQQGQGGQASGNQAGGRNEQQPQQQRRFYRVQEGDTLGAIAAEFGTTVDDLLALNPGIDPVALSPGQRVRVR
jgi:LysM domain